MNNRFYIPLMLAGLLTLGLGACDLFDPTNAENPNVSTDGFLDLDNSVELWLDGLERQMTIAMNNDALDTGDGYITAAEIASDNYVNTQTFFNQFMDNLVIQFTDQDIEESLFSLADLRESAEFGISTIVPSDPEANPDDVASLAFFKGMANLITGELFHLAPADSAGPAVPSADQFAQAAADFTNAINQTTNENDRIGFLIARARAYRLLGDRVNARADAEAVIASDPDYVRFTVHDFTNGPNNDIQDALFDRGTFDDLQPLPRLDFLDPKYFNTAQPNLRGDDEDADVAYLKSEEAFLILAEVQAAENDIPGAQATLKSLLEIVSARPTERLADVTEGRTHDAPGSRPNTSDWGIAASPDDPVRMGLVVDRAEESSFPTISGTSVTDDLIDAAATQDDMLELIYLMRQEIFIAEGRRMTDLGIKWPVPRDEATSNANINEGDPATEAQIPDFLPANEMDSFDIDETTREVTILHNLNRILVQNKASDLVMPFF